MVCCSRKQYHFALDADSKVPNRSLNLCSTITCVLLFVVPAESTYLKLAVVASLLLYSTTYKVVIIAMFQGSTDPLPAGSFGSTRAALHHVGKLTLNLYKRTLLLRLTWTAAAGLT
jgi:hypothetical protein